MEAEQYRRGMPERAKTIQRGGRPHYDFRRFADIARTRRDNQKRKSEKRK